MVSVTGDRKDPKNIVIAGNQHQGVVFDGVGQLVIPGIKENIYGTANLINKQFLITSKHNFPGGFPNNVAAAGHVNFDVTTFSGGAAFSETIRFKAENVRFAEDADLVIIKLDRAPFNIDSYRLYSGAPGSELGQKYLHVGYGRSGNGVDGEVSGELTSTKRWGTNHYEAERSDSKAGHLLMSDFDSGSLSHNTYGTKEGTGVMEVTSTTGDSGGANFINGEIATITHGGPRGSDSKFGQIAWDVQVSKYLPWINATIEELSDKNSLKSYIGKLEGYMNPAEWTTDVKEVVTALIAPQSSTGVQSGLKINPGTIKLDGAGGLGTGYEGGQHGIFESIDLGGGGRAMGHGILLTTGGMPKFQADNGLGSLDEIPPELEGDGDADLDKLIPGFTTHDASTLSFTFKNTTSHNAVTFKVMLGSDEYGEGPDTMPDIAGIFVNGKNFAVFSNGKPLAVTKDMPKPGEDGLFGPAAHIEYDGITKTLLVVADARPHADNTVKIVIADAHHKSTGHTGNGDSGLFVSDMRLVTLADEGLMPGMMNIIQGLNGTAQDDLITGDDTPNTLNGGEGGDLLVGKKGNDIFKDVFGNNVFDGGDGFDTIDYLDNATGVEVDLATNISLNVSYESNVIRKPSAKDTFKSIEAVIGTKYLDKLSGNEFANTLKGGGGVDYLDGRGGADTLIGGTESDVYYVDNLGDVIVENANEGTDDYVYATVNWKLADTLEHLSLQGTKGLTGIGNGSNNKINGTVGDDILAGLGGADRISGSGGNDTITYEESTAGVNVSLATNKNFGGHAEGDLLAAFENVTGSKYDDIIEGYADNNAIFGNNILRGGLGVDTVSYANATGKVKVSLAVTTAQVTGGAGTDTLSGFENLTGSAFNDDLTGSSIANILNGLAGADRMTGGDGNDTYIVDNAGDVVVEVAGQGADLVRSGISSYTLGTYVENLELTGNAVTGIGSAYGNKMTGNDLANTLKGKGGDDIIRGGAGDDILDGGSGNDRINGGLGADKMYGGIDKDTFVFTSVSDSTANSIGRFNSATGDIIDRFVRGEDKIDLSAIDANMALAGDQSFHFGWDGKAGALTVTSLAKTVGGFPGYENHVFADIGGDGKADMVFVAYSFDKLTVTDFVL